MTDGARSPRRPRWRRRVLRAAWFAAGALLALLAFERALDLFWPYPIEWLRALPVSTVVTAQDGTWLRVLPTPAGERVLPLAWAEAAPALRAAVLAGEDERFFSHAGVDAFAVLRALLTNVQRGRVVSGASTLTMQVVRIVEPRPRTLWSKVLEAVRARQLERALGKEEIASVWLTHVPLGGTLRGFEAAARYWFGCSARELDAASAAALVAMVPAPSARSPHRRPALLGARRDALLEQLALRGDLPPAELAAAKAAPLGMARHPWPWLAPHACDGAMAQLASPRPTIVRTAIDLELQARVAGVVAAHPDLPGDGLAVVVVDRRSGQPCAVLGDRDPLAPLDLSRRPRSAGSTLKPFLFALGFELGALREDALLDDSPLGYADWRPANFDRGHRGRLRPADALATSNNLVAVRCLEAVGTDAFADLLRRLGLPSAHGALFLDAALGTSDVTPLHLALAYRRFVDDPASLALSQRSVAATLRGMQRLAPVPGQTDAGDVAWKSGTSSGRRDAWCVTVTDRHILVCWLGNKDGRGAANLVGIRTANALASALTASLRH